MRSAADKDPPSEVSPGQVIGGKWRVLGLLGRGGMGAVYEAQNVSIGKKVALKFIDAEFANQPEITSRFQREAEAASLVESAHIVDVFDTGIEGGLPYIVMELLRGEDLRARLRRTGRIPKEEAVHIVAQTLRGLHRAHEAGIVHRDLKPENIFLVARDDDPLFAKIVDFGISKMQKREGDSGTSTLTRQGVVLGTPFYMSPEQAQAFADLDLRTDLWSVGAILYECLAGRPPYQGDAYEQIIVAICTKDPVDLAEIDPALPRALVSFVKKAMDRDRKRRFQSAKEMLEALQSGGLLAPSIHGTGSSPALSSTAKSDRVSESGGAGTRISWTSAHAETQEALSGTKRRARATGMRKRGLVALGVSVTAATFVLTLGILRTRREHRPTSTKASPSVTAAATSARETEATGATTASLVPVSSEAASSAHLPSPLTPRGGKKPAATPVMTAAAAPRESSTATTTSPPKPTPGVAGGLQIKTNYP